MTQDLPARGGGDPLPASTRGSLEQSFGVDLGGVRVGESAAVDAMGAQAYAQGDQVRFAPGAYDPGTSEGMFLVAHEVAHLVQQSAGRASPSGQAYGQLVNSDASLEAEADTMAARAVRGEPAFEGAGAGGLRPLSPSRSAPMQLKLRVGRTWHDHIPRTNAAKITEQWGFGPEVLEVLRAWAADEQRTEDRIFDTWRAAAQAAQQGGAAAGANGGGAGLSWQQWLVLLLVVLMIFSPIILPFATQMMHPRYEVRSDLRDTARTATRPLEPLLPVAQAAQNGTLTMDSLEAHLATAGMPADVNVSSLLQMVPPQIRTVAEQSIGQVGNAAVPHDFGNPCNTGLYHQHIFLPESNVGAFDDGLRADRPDMLPHYRNQTARHYDAPLMHSAIDQVAPRHQTYEGLTNNCQDFVGDAVATYHARGGREIVPSEADAFLLTLCDVLTGWGPTQRYLDNAVHEALNEKLAGASQAPPRIEAPLLATHTTDITAAQQRMPPPSPSAQPPSIPTTPEGVAQALGISPELLRAAIDQMMSRTIDIPEQGAVTLRRLACEPKNSRCQSVLEGAMYELVVRFAEQDITSQLPGAIRNNDRARTRLVGDLAQRITRDLMARFKIQEWVCAAPVQPEGPPTVVQSGAERPTHTTRTDEKT